jgi:hypothetical protein
MRDQIKNEGLKALTKELEDAINEFNKDIKSSNNEIFIRRAKVALVSMSVQKTIALYSSGKSKEEVKNSMLQALEIFNDYFKWLGVEMGYGDYDYMVWMVSLGILCDIDLEDFKRITAVIQRDGAQDKLLDFIIKSKQEDWVGNNDSYLQEIPYAETANIASAEDIQYYLDKVWYQGHDEAYWHDLHKNTKANRYFGYWAWEVAAIAKIKGIDDVILKDHKYYPYDSVHW